jgi:hypothetical protein
VSGLGQDAEALWTAILSIVNRGRCGVIRNDRVACRGVIAMTVQRKRGRPSDYYAEIAMTICDRLAEGESLRAICADAGMPDKATVLRWMGRHKEFRDQYAWAREAQADDILEEILEIADDSSRDG